jgi:hypothetical protein
VLDKKGKGYADAKWEAEVRQKLNAKKTQVTLSKQDQALVNEQLQKEAEIRKRVSGIRAKLEHGLELVHSLSSANVESSVLMRHKSLRFFSERIQRSF